MPGRLAREEEVGEGGSIPAEEEEIWAEQELAARGEEGPLSLSIDLI